jgi:hypothetical protein
MIQLLACFADNKIAGKYCKDGLSFGAGHILFAGE